MVPPLLVDMMRRVVVSRLERAGVTLSILAELTDPAELAATLLDLMPDVVVAKAEHLDLPPTIPVMTLSRDLGHLRGPGAKGSAPLTPESLAARLLALVDARPGSSAGR